MCCVITYYLRFWALRNNVQNRDDDPQCERSGEVLFGGQLSRGLAVSQPPKARG